MAGLVPSALARLARAQGTDLTREG